MQVFELSFEETATLDRLSAEIAGTTRRSTAAKRVLFRRLAEDFIRLEAYLDTVAGAAERLGETPACSAGCAWCCHQDVHVSALEAFYLAESLEHFPEAEALKAKILETAETIRGLTSIERFAKHVPCPLLDTANGLCTAYQNRPFICRSAHSTSVNACKKAYRKGSAESPIGAIRRFFMLGFIARQGYIDGLRQGGLPSRNLELVAALAAILRTPDAFERWSTGEDIFATA